MEPDGKKPAHTDEQVADLCDQIAQEKYPIGEHLKDWPEEDQTMQQVAWLACYAGVGAGLKAAREGRGVGVASKTPASRLLAPDSTVRIKTSEIQRLVDKASDNVRAELHDTLIQVHRCVKENHRHHEGYDDYGGYQGSELQDMNIKALEAIQSILIRK